MEKKCVTTYYNKIENVCDFPIDCKQGLYISLLHCLGKTIAYAGARWPWIFYYKPRIDPFDIEANKLIDIVNSLTINSMNKTFNVDLEYCFFNTCTDMMNYIRYNISNDTPVIVNTDQYYIHYHHEYVYLQKHGLHATMLMGYDDDKENVFCFSATPEYKGVISYNELRESISNSSILWCAVLKKSIEPCVEKSDEIIFKDFQANIREVANEYNVLRIRPLQPNMQIYTKDILSIFSESSDSNDNTTYDNIKKLCDGRWGWEINTNINLFIKYISTYYVSCQYGDISNILCAIEDYRTKWDVAYRKMFKMSIRKPKDIKKEIDLVIKNLKVLVDCEKMILNQLII